MFGVLTSTPRSQLHMHVHESIHIPPYLSAATDLELCFSGKSYVGCMSEGAGSGSLAPLYLRM